MMDLSKPDKPMQKNTIFRIYSMTKPIAAVGVMMLCEEGKLTLDAPGCRHIYPELGGTGGSTATLTPMFSRR